nr:MAG TPA_asm: hypothetical protein [Caudoviricetes sp.]
MSYFVAESKRQKSRREILRLFFILSMKKILQ